MYFNLISLGKNFDIQHLILWKFDIIELNVLNKKIILNKIFYLTFVIFELALVKIVKILLNVMLMKI